jgi:23S rRNA (pseudouridine1915-N3)-methyltransferase
MITIKILTMGKAKERWIEEGFADYQKRLSPKLLLQLILARHEEQLIQLAQKERGLVVGLDSQGDSLTSEQFSQRMYRYLEEGGARLCFVIGGAEGLPPLLKTSLPLLSLSSLTFPHQMARLILAEQIYRAVEIRKNSPYHR